MEVRQEALAQEVQVLLPTLASLPMAAMITDCNGVVCWANPCLGELTGYAVGEIVGQEARLLLAEDATHAHREILQHVVASGEPWRGESAVRRKTGELCGVEQTITPLRNGSHAIRHVLWTLHGSGGAAEVIQRANEAATKAEAHYRLLFNSTSDAVFVHGLGDGGIPEWREVNDNACRLLGYTRAELQGMPALDVIAPEERPALPAHAEKLLLDGRLLWQGVLIGKNGRRIPVEANVHRLSRDGSPAFLSAVTDISERLEAEKQFRDIFDGALEGMFRTSSEGKPLAANSALATILGYDSASQYLAEVFDVGRQVWMEPAEHSRYLQLLEQQDVIRGHECRLKRRDGTAVWVSLNSRKVRGDDGRTLYSAGFLEDITERKRAEGALRDSEQLLKASQKVAGLGSYVLDMLTGTWSSSAVMDDIFGIDETFVRSVEGWLSLVHPEWREQMIDHFTNWVLGKGNRFDKEYQIVRLCDGQARWVHGLGELEFDKAGQPVKMFGTILDITERKTAEAQKAKLEDQLRQAQKLESVGRLAGGVAHDFNNLLTVINGYSGFLLKGLKAGDPLRTYAEEIKTAGDRAASLTKQLLAFSRKQIIEPRVLDLNATIRESAPMLQRLIGEDIVLKTNLDGSLGRVMADPDQIHQVIMNLAVNARDAMANGGTLAIETRNVEIGEAAGASMHPAATPGRYIAMTVTDTGHGIDATIRDQIFEPFFTTKEVGKGTGLGLSTVYGIIRQSRGWIDVQSEVGAGTSFKICLPRIDAQSAPEQGVSAATGKGDETILVVEDQYAVRTFAGVVLRAHDYLVLEASDGVEAIAVAERHPGPIHLLLTDVVMPEMDGKELSERLMEMRPTLKVLFISGYTADVIAHRGVLNPGVAFLHKPFSSEGLAAKVREVLGGSAMGVVE
jgi:PAS domain S-box-containing protein